MNYSLGNMLGGAGGLNPDKLSLDLQFAADKTLTARRGPTPTFTRASTARFVGSDGLIQSAAINTARFDHDPVTLASRGLLIEESRTNLALRSEDFGNATWVKSNATISGTLYTAPTGASTANELVEDILLANHTCVQNAATATIGTTYTFSVFVKRKDTSNQFMLIGASGLVNASFISVNLTNGVTATGIGSPGSPINVSSTAYPNGWYRVQFSVVATFASAAVFDIRLSRDGTWANRSYLGDGVQSSLIWGAQLEAGSFPTSYIPTTTASVVRSGDVCSITGSSFTGFYNQSEGTVLTDSIPAAVAGTTTVFGLSNGTANERWLNRFAQNEQVVITSAGTESVIDAINPVAGQRYKVVVTGKLNDFAMSINGLAAVTDTSQPMPVVDRAGIGTPTGVAASGVSTIASIRYYKKRLSNAKIQALSTV